ncbi:TetR/AcrR family transcriptional regulator [Kitasatospora sp. NPDC048365]|uniref:TetR/AcrR family transcriptional regulator n=1 Tax=Kitasatospora sp. NPDC048365 TaxID=3364050 RepID=UPI00371DDF6C
MTTEPKPSSRDRLLDAAAALAYTQGVGVGIEALCKAAGVSKRSMYQLFDSKDDLLAASLERRAAAYAATLLPDTAGPGSPRLRILHVFEQLETQASSPQYAGCPYLAVQIELKNSEHPASRVADRVKQGLGAFFLAEARRGGALDPELLARQLLLLFDGASARAGIHAETLTGLLAPTAVTLLDAAGVA